MPVSINNTTLTFNDATTQTTSGVTSIGTGTGISSTGGKTPTLTNTGVTSVTAGSGISVSSSTGGVTISASGGGVTSLNGQTGAITNTSLDAIGSVVFALHAISSGTGPANQYTFNNNAAGTTVAGSNLRYTWAPLEYIVPGAAYKRRVSPNNQNIAYNGGGAALSGTWRFMGYACRVYYTDSSESECVWLPILCVRIS